MESKEQPQPQSDPHGNEMMPTADRGFSASKRSCDPLKAWEACADRCGEAVFMDPIDEQELDAAKPFPFDGQIVTPSVAIDQAYYMLPEQFVRDWFGMDPERVAHPDVDMLLWLALQARMIVLVPDYGLRGRSPSYGSIVLRCRFKDADGDYFDDIYWDQWDGFEFYAPVCDWLWAIRGQRT